VDRHGNIALAPSYDVDAQVDDLVEELVHAV